MGNTVLIEKLKAISTKLKNNGKEIFKSFLNELFKNFVIDYVIEIFFKKYQAVTLIFSETVLEEIFDFIVYIFTRVGIIWIRNNIKDKIILTTINILKKIYIKVNVTVKLIIYLINIKYLIIQDKINGYLNTTNSYMKKLENINLFDMIRKMKFDTECIIHSLNYTKVLLCKSY